MKYPNLKEAAPYFAVAYFANITPELLEKVIKGNEELTATEAINICRFSGIPHSVLFNAKLITFNKNRRRHKAMMEELEKKLYAIWDWQKKGSHEADIYMKYRRAHYVNLYMAFINKGVIPYCRYLGVKQEMEDALLFIRNELSKIQNKPRGLKKAAV